MSTITPKLYVKTGCPWCAEAMAFLDQHQIAYHKIVVSGNASAMEEMVTLSGQSKAPTMDWDGEILADFGAAELEPFLRQRGVIS
jgi:glutaredoxin